MSPTLLNWAKEALITQIEALLDDPRGVTEGRPSLLIRTVNEYRVVATELGMNFDRLLDSHGNHFETTRLRMMIHKAASEL